MRVITLGGREVPVLGQGTWKMGESRARRDSEIAALRRGIELGMTLIDTAEMYGSGRSEELVGEAIRGRRDDVTLVSKVLPGNASHRGTIKACEQSLRRLGTDHLDVYLLHWQSPHPLGETVGAFEELQRQGKIRAWGVSNFDRDLMAQTLRFREPPATNQVLYNLARRWPEAGLLDDLRAHGVPLMAYSPIEQGEFAATGSRTSALHAVAKRHGASPAQIALAWVIAQPGVIAIPKASSIQHVEENAVAAHIALTPEDLTDLEAAFPPPQGHASMEVY